MKRFAHISVFTLLLILPCLQAFAQKDIKVLDQASDAAIRSTFGAPKEMIRGYDNDFCYYYSDCSFSLAADSRALVSFQTESPKYCILTNLVSGGIRVGDNIAKLKRIDWSKTTYGRNKPGNNLKQLPEEPNEYIIFEDEIQSVYITVKNGYITFWLLDTKEEFPYEPYDNKNLLF